MLISTLDIHRIQETLNNILPKEFFLAHFRGKFKYFSGSVLFEPPIYFLMVKKVKFLEYRVVQI